MNVSDEHNVVLLVSGSYGVHLKVLSEIAVGKRHPTHATPGTEPEQKLLLDSLDPLHVGPSRPAPHHATVLEDRANVRYLYQIDRFTK